MKKKKGNTLRLALCLLGFAILNTCIYCRINKLNDDMLKNLQTIYNIQVQQRDDIEDIYNYTFGLTELYTEKQMSCQELEEAYNVLRDKHVQEALLLDEIICGARRHDIPKCTNYE